MRISYLNGEFVPHDAACVHIEDRGLQFSDAVYEVVAFFNGRLLDFDPHYLRLERSLGALAITNPLTAAELEAIMERLIAENHLTEGIVYLQITRGVAPRDHAFPVPPVSPTVIATAAPLDMKAIRERQKSGVAIILVDENRWARPDIKSTSLLGNVLAKQAARQAGAYEAVFVGRDGHITEGTSTNVWLINGNNTLVTRKTDGAILSGITRGAVMKAVSSVEERTFTKDELLAAKEVFLTSTTSLVMPVVVIDGQKVGTGRPGAGLETLKKIYADYIKAQTGYAG